MSGSIISLTSNSDNNLCNYGVHNYVQVRSKQSCKDYKNLTNLERQNLDQSLKKSMFEYSHQGVSEISFYNSLNASQCIDSANLRRLNQTLTHSSRAVIWNSNTTPKIVGAEIKKNIKYQPVYMQRHSTIIGEDFQTELSHNIHQSKRSSVAIGEGFANLLHMQIQSNCSAVSRTFITQPTSMSTSPMDDEQSSIIQTGNCVKDRVSFFNKLASESGSSTSRLISSQPKETFLSLLRKNESKDSKTTIVRLSQLMATLSAKNTKRTASKETVFGMKSPDPGAGKCCTHVYKSGSNSLPMPLRRKPSFEKTKVATSSIAKNMNSIGTNLRRHSLMEDLSLVVPVKLRIAEFEKRILASK